MTDTIAALIAACDQAEAKAADASDTALLAVMAEGQAYADARVKNDSTAYRAAKKARRVADVAEMQLQATIVELATAEIRVHLAKGDHAAVDETYALIAEMGAAFTASKERRRQ